MSNKLITLGATCKQLGIARPTLTRRMKRLGIVPQHNALNLRESYITQEDIERLVSEYAAFIEHSVNVQDSINKRSLSETELLVKIEKLERTIAQLSRDALQGDYDSASDKRVAEYRPRSPRTAIHATNSDAPPLPEGWESLKGFCESHGIPPTTVRHAIAASRLPQSHRGRWLQGRATVLNAVDEDMQAEILRMYVHKDEEE